MTRMRMWPAAILICVACSRQPGLAVATKTPAPTVPAAANTLDEKSVTRRFDESEDDWKKRWWVAKVARVLRGGQGLSLDEDADAYAAMSRKQVVDTFMNDPRFVDTLVDFNRFFLGFKGDSVREASGKISEDSLSFAQAVQAATATARDGDFFSLFQMQQPFYMTPLFAPISFPDPTQPTGPGTDPSADPEKTRMQYFANAQKFIEEHIAHLQQDPNWTPAQTCSALFTEGSHGYDILQTGMPTRLVTELFDATDWYSKLIENCAKGTIQPAEFLALLQSIHSINENLIKFLPQFAPATYKPTEWFDFKVFDLSQIDPKLSLHFFSPLARLLPNSSTNMDRKRGAYVLDRFFCDDLTPINVEDSGDHAGGRHASEASCQACHFKLDPMAGFFKDYGGQFKNFSSTPSITFDDGAKADLTTYESNWRAEAGSTHDWNVGYVRSSSREQLNDYGTSLDDLFNIVHRAPEVKRCIAKRLFEYLIAPDQALDGSYLDDLSSNFSTTTSEHSGQELKTILRTLVLSASFSEPDPQPDQCYDFGKAHDATSSLPCRISTVVQRNCISCHAGSPADEAAGGLDLSRWVAQANGLSGFPHVDEHGQPVDRVKTLESILQRLSDTDSDRRMPLRKFMTSADREQLYLWVNEQLNAASPPVPVQLKGQVHVVK